MDRESILSGVGLGGDTGPSNQAITAFFAVLYRKNTMKE